MPVLSALLDRLAVGRVLAIVRGDDRDACLASVHTLVAAGVDVVEVSLTGTGALDVITRARAELGDAVWLGAGTVLTAEQADAAVGAGAAFVVTPGAGAGAEAALRAGVPALVGALTPTEVAGVVAAGATAVKVFPASLGGPGYLAALRQPFPTTPFVPVGGVGLEVATDYLAAGAVAVGIGSPLLGDAPAGGDQGALRARADELLARVRP